MVRGWLGIVIQDLTPELAASFGVKKDAGVLVADVMKDEPGPSRRPQGRATSSSSFDGAPIKDVTELQKRVAAVEPGRADAARR